MSTITVPRTVLEKAQEALEKARDTTHSDTLYAQFEVAITALRAALAQQERHVSYVCPQCYWSLEQPEPKQEPVAWISVTDALPKSGVTVLACYRNSLGKLRRIRAHWIAAKTVEANCEDWDQCSEYDEATDLYYVTEGWFECIDNWGDYSAVAVSEGDVTHWMPLPEAPQEVVA